jgi:hypothetical protein
MSSNNSNNNNKNNNKTELSLFGGVRPKMRRAARSRESFQSPVGEGTHRQTGGMIH